MTSLAYSATYPTASDVAVGMESPIGQSGKFVLAYVKSRLEPIVLNAEEGYQTQRKADFYFLINLIPHGDRIYKVDITCLRGMPSTRKPIYYLGEPEDFSEFVVHKDFVMEFTEITGSKRQLVEVKYKKP